ncbi:MAG: 3-hydroxyacyl-CoA dehydrogenase/enoyl-CoA hydratase family protein [Alphaproteobacteria bacterium]|nr:3-hydroxyacyl-CoA dehydrogenase/enoyl-CoA hydratase family protein [Alphaproteobacteria bacterium]
MSIKKAAVIGSGVMGSGIAAQIANAGVPVVLLDIKLEGKNLARDAIDRMMKTDPAPLMSKRNAKLITPGNLDDDIALLEDCDWIVEVVLEDLKIKHATYEKINKHRKKGSIVSSNTSTIPLALLIKGQGADFAKDFLITHFFNPPRYLRLMELVTGPKTRKDAIDTIADFCDTHLGKGVVRCNDTPGFIGNRIGVFWLTTALNAAIEDGISVETADSVMGKPVGIPKTGVFGLLDLIGIDLMPHLADSLLSTLPKADAYQKAYIDHPFIHGMIEAGYTGRKGKGGFYRLDKTDGRKEKQSFPLNGQTFSESAFTKSLKPRLDSVAAGKQGLKAVVTTDDEGGRYAWKVLSRTLAYAASCVPDITDDIAAVDDAMKMGYNWKKGPFEMMDDLGPAWFAQALEKEGIKIPDVLSKVGEGSFYKIEDGKRHVLGTDGQYHVLKRPDGVLLLGDIKLASDPVFKTGSAALWDIGDGVLCTEFTGKMNALDEGVFEVYQKAIKLIGDMSGDYKALVIYNEGSHFSAGANLGLAMFAMNIALWPQIEALVEGGQKIYKALKYAPFPVIAAPSGMALGGGCEILLHADHVQAHAETYCGLVEVGVGLLPGWGGCKEMLLRYQAEEQDNYDKATGGKTMWFSPKTTPMGAVRKAFETIAMARVAKSAQEAKEIRYLKASDGVTMNRDRLLFDAKQKALALAKEYKAPEPVSEIRLPGPSGKMALDMAVSDLCKSGRATPYDVTVSGAVATVLTGGEKADWTAPLSEEDLYKLERTEFMKLVHNDGTMNRIEHMLTTGKPLRN